MENTLTINNQISQIVVRFMNEQPKRNITMREFAENLNKVFGDIEDFKISHQVLWYWKVGKHVPRRRNLQLLLRFADQDSWQWRLANELLELISESE